MSDYARQDDFSAKSGQVILGSDVDAEFDALVVAVNSKVDESREGAANGIATLGAGALLPAGISGAPTTSGGQIPEASATALGAVELATSAEAITGTDPLRVITAATLDAVLENAGGMLGDIKDLVDPNADRILFWDDSAGATTVLTVSGGLEISTTTLQIANSIAGTGLAESAGVISLSHLGLQSLTDPGADRVPFWDETTNAIVWGTLGLGLTTSGTTIGIADAAVSSTSPILIASGAFGFDPSSLTAITGAGLAGGDIIAVYDASAAAMKSIELVDAGYPTISTASTSIGPDYPTSKQGNVMYITTAATAVSFTIPPNSTDAWPIGTTFIIYQSGAGQVTVSVTTDTLRSPNGAKTAQQYSVIQVIKTGTTEWVVTGDTTG